MKTVLIVFGTRPEAIKMAPIVLELSKCSYFDVKVCVTAQHRKILDQVMSLFKINAHYDLDIMTEDQDLTQTLGKICSGVQKSIADCDADFVLVHGDTLTSLGASLAAFLSRVKVGHVEAGLRTDNLFLPWPEEGARRAITALTSLHFCPTKIAVENLEHNGVELSNIFLTGNTVIDALRHTLNTVEIEFNGDTNIFKHLFFFNNGKRVVLITCHRRENFGVGIKNLCTAINELSLSNPNVNFVYPVHPNPNIRNVVIRSLNDKDNVFLIDPLDYKEFVFAMKSAYIILTDSGGIQEEAPFLCKPVLLLRDNTERPEAISAGTVVQVGTEPRKIVNFVQRLLNSEEYYEDAVVGKINPYGDGYASVKIRRILEELLLD
ncbi:MAG: UDP-N-acetylglucosamine 2-epimerase (non-hydrolyzing) [Paracoccaceae bacterium]